MISFDAYCLDRILSINGFRNADSFYIDIGDGYYGQELDGVYLNMEGYVNKQILEMLALPSITKKIEYVLKLEYGYLLDCVKDREWEIKKVYEDELSFGQCDHYQKLNKNVCLEYENYPYAKGICIPSENKYKVIDGYHRLSSTESPVEIICAK